jgi:hypothetical protein
MKQHRSWSWLLLAVAWLTSAPSAPAAENPIALSDADKEAFLVKGAIVDIKAIDHGVTKPQRATLADGKWKHDVQIQIVNRELPAFIRGDKAFPSFDRWSHNIAAYKLDRLLRLNMVPVSVERKHGSAAAAFTWWADDVAMEEVDRRKRELQPPDPEAFTRQLELGKVFDELIINIDRNLSNLLITNDWHVVLIDHTRAFTPYPEIRNAENLTRCSRRLLANMKGLTKATVTAAVDKALTSDQVDALLLRRDKIVSFFEKRTAQKGEAAVLFP